MHASTSHGAATTTAPSSVRWKIFRRYSHFDCLNTKIKKQLPSNFTERFPSKRRFKSNFETNFLRERRLKLEAWLRQVIRWYSTLTAKQQLWLRRFLTAKANAPPFRMTSPIKANSKHISSTPCAPLRATTLSDFHKVRMLGIGAYGRVILVQHAVTLKLYAMKVLSKAAAVEHDQRVSYNCQFA